MSGLECSGPTAVTPKACDAVAFWSASAGVPAPVLASPGSTSTTQAPHCSQGLHNHRLTTAVSAPAPVLAAAADEVEPRGLTCEQPAAAGQRACSLTSMQQAELVHCQQSGAHGGAESSLGGASVFGSEHRAVRDWLATCGVSGSLDCAESAVEEATEEDLPPVMDPPSPGGPVRFAAHTVVCAGFSPARRHMSEQTAGARQRAALQLRRAQTCPEPLNQEVCFFPLMSYTLLHCRACNLAGSAFSAFSMLCSGICSCCTTGRHRRAGIMGGAHLLAPPRGVGCGQCARCLPVRPRDAL